eukprot:7378428-Prymnesium_polylepis.1
MPADSAPPPARKRGPPAVSTQYPLITATLIAGVPFSLASPSAWPPPPGVAPGSAREPPRPPPPCPAPPTRPQRVECSVPASTRSSAMTRTESLDQLSGCSLFAPLYPMINS